MEKGFDRLNAALQDIASEDAARSPRRIEPRIAAELRRRRRRLSPSSLAAGYAIAATVVAALAASLWIASTRSERRTPSTEPRAASAAEITTAFMPLIYSGVPYTDAQIVRFEVPRIALRNFGLAAADLPTDAVPADSQPTVIADVVVGEDGLARAVRFVRRVNYGYR